MTACVASLCEHVGLCTLAHCHGLAETIWRDLCRILYFAKGGKQRAGSDTVDLLWDGLVHATFLK